MIRGKLRVRVNKNTTKNIKSAMFDALHESLEEVKTKLRSHQPDSYQNTGGGLNQLLEAHGIEPYSGRLASAWNKTIDQIKPLRYGGKLKFNIFKSTILNNDTTWFGVISPPKRKKRQNELDRSTVQDRDIGRRSTMAVSVSDSAFRPLPTGRKFKWVQNPYPGYGYWLLYEQGTFDSGIQYRGRRFITEAYTSVFGQHAPRMIAVGDTGVRFSKSFIHEFTQNVYATYKGKYRGK